MSTSIDSKAPAPAYDPSSSSANGNNAGGVYDNSDPFSIDSEQPAAPRPRKQPRNPNDQSLVRVQPLTKAQMQPSYAQELNVDHGEHGWYGAMMNSIGNCMAFFGSIPCCLCCPNPFKEVRQGSVGLVSRFGAFYKSTDPGLVRINPCSESLQTVSVMIQVAAIPSQTVMTRDNVNVRIDSVIYYHVTNPYRAVYGVADVRQALIERAQTTLRNVVGSRVLQSVVTEREAVATEIEEIVANVSENWGVTVEAILIKDILFSEELQASLSSAAQQKRMGEAKVIAARAEVESAKLMRQAADILASPAAMQIRQLETLTAMAKTSGSKTIFMPMHLANMGDTSQIQAQMQAAQHATGAGGGGVAGEGSSTGQVAQLAALDRL